MGVQLRALQGANARLGPLSRVGRIGDLSYGLYIYAFPIQHVWMKYTGLNAHGHGVLFALVFATTSKSHSRRGT